MFDSYSDSEQSISLSQINTKSDDDNYIIAEVAVEQLTEKNASLIKENNILKSQFEQAVKNADKVDVLQKENNKLAAEVRELSQEKEEFKKRLEFSNRAQKELNSQLQNEINSNSQLRSENESALRQEMKRVKAIYKTQFATLYDQVNTLQESKNQSDIQNKICSAKIGKCLEAAQRFFHVEVEDMDSLVKLFDSSQTSAKAAAECEQQQKYAVEDDNSNKKKIKKLKSSLKQLIAKSEALENENDQLNNKINHFNITKKKIEEDNKAKIDELNEIIRNNADDHQREINRMQSKIENLNEKLSKQKPTVDILPQVSLSQPVLTQNNADFDKEKNSYEKQIANLEESNEDLSGKISKLERENKNLQKQNEKLAQNNQKLEEEKNKAISNSKKANDELFSLKMVHEEMVKEAETLRTAFSNSKNANEQSKFNSIVKKEFRKQKAQIKQLDATVDAQKREITEIEEEKAAVEEISRAQKIEIEKLKNENVSLQDAVNQLKTDMSDQQIQLERKIAKTSENIIPSTAWNSSEFSEKLKIAINKIADNSSLKPTLKLQTIYKCIKEYYKKELNGREKAIKEIFAEKEDEKEMFSDFIVSISIALTNSPITYDAFVAGASQSLVETATDLNKAYVEVTRQLDLLHSYTDTFNTKFEIDDNRDLAQMTEQVIAKAESVAKQKCCLKKYKKLCESLKGKALNNEKEIEKAVAGKENEISLINERLEEEKQKVKCLNSKISSLNSENQSLKGEKKILKDKVAQLQTENDSLKFENNELTENNNAAILNAANAAKNEVSQEMNQLHNTVSSQKEKISDLKTNFSREKSLLKDKIESLSNENEDLEQKVNELTSDFEAEKKKIIESYEKAISEIKTQCDSHRNDIKNFSQQLLDADKKNKACNLSVLKAKKEKGLIEKQMKKQKEEFEREKKLIQSRSQVAITTAESSALTKVDEMSVRFEKEKKRLINFIIAQLGTGNESNGFDEKAMRSVVFDAREKLERFIKMDESIRRIIQADEGQSTDEAVAQLVLQN